MEQKRLSRAEKQQRAEAEQRRRRALVIGGAAAAVLLALGTALYFAFREPPPGTTDDPAKLRLEKLFELYRTYTLQQKKPPPSEQALKEFLRGLPEEQKKAAGLAGDVDSFFVSPRDGQKYVVRWNHKLDAGGATQAVIWEAAGRNGQRYVALSVGYVEEYDEETFQSYRK